MKLLGILVGAAALAAGAARADNPVIVHEWGTFTCLQDERGNAIGGINVDDEPVPDFVYGSRTGDVVAHPGLGLFGLPPYDPYAGKGESAFIAKGDPAVTIRLETPVLYIYPPRGEAPASVPPLDVGVGFHHGLLSQYYPYAETGFARLYSWLGPPGIPAPAGFQLTATTTSLAWRNVRLGSTGQPVQTDDKVWTTPRQTRAPLLEVRPRLKDAGGVVHNDPQVEHFLFYRGVGHLDSPVMLNRSDRLKDTFEVWSSRGNPSAPKATYAGGWLVDIDAPGSCAFREIASFEEGEQARLRPMTKLISRFDPPEFSADNLAKLKASMHAALVDAGLFDDEATAMLNTWELSYFKSPGLRFFYVVPRAWVDDVLPLKITGAPARVTRVMIGRIELISPEERAALARLAAGPCPDLPALKQAAQQALNRQTLTDAQRQAFLSGARPLGELGVEVPPRVQDYLSLGRFRDALILHEQAYHPSPALAQFIRDNQL